MGGEGDVAELWQLWAGLAGSDCSQAAGPARASGMRARRTQGGGGRRWGTEQIEQEQVEQASANSPR